MLVGSLRGPRVLDCESEPIVPFDPNRSESGRFARGATGAHGAAAPNVTVTRTSVSVEHPHGSKWVKQDGRWVHMVRDGGTERCCSCSGDPRTRQQAVTAGKREAARFANAAALNARTVSDAPDGNRWPALTGPPTDGCMPVSAGGAAWSVHASAADAAASFGCKEAVAERRAGAPPNIIWQGPSVQIVAPASPSMAARA